MTQGERNTVTDISTAPAQAPVGVFSRDQVEMLAARKLEPAWLHAARLAAHEAFSSTPMPSRAEEDWRYSWQRFGKTIDFDAYAFPEERKPVTAADQLPAGLRAVIEEGGETAASLAQVDSSVVWRELPESLAAQG